MTDEERERRRELARKVVQKIEAEEALLNEVAETINFLESAGFDGVASALRGARDRLVNLRRGE